ncbi:50S ribosomal protein L21 [Mucisphaera calidilacus]|uniref:Large ribosomal subunit protein bL21 n=1 Tax=Mucisphaera calidilacus TaxID=2527982 RepID=A0A518BTD9_9BACT|nr:50S ribosomal protein L21 [Mucisphaera calidilacus]QDU70237.1 50S ribosomal protein L21 [Mucisphaera calidilacus]
MYAVIEDSGTQIKVAEGDTIRIDPRELPEDAKSLTFDRVVFMGEGVTAKVGAPYVEGASVEAEILEEGRAEKIEVVKFKRRKTYRRRRGHRQPYVEVKITKIAG